MDVGVGVGGNHHGKSTYAATGTTPHVGVGGSTLPSCGEAGVGTDPSPADVGVGVGDGLSPADVVGKQLGGPSVAVASDCVAAAMKEQVSPIKRPRLICESSRVDMTADMTIPVSESTHEVVGSTNTATLRDAQQWAIQWLEKQMRERDKPNRSFSDTSNEWILSLKATT